MTNSPRKRAPESGLTPAACLRRLPELTLDTADSLDGVELRRVELSRSLLTIAELNHVSESALVYQIVANVCGSTPLDE